MVQEENLDTGEKTDLQGLKVTKEPQVTTVKMEKTVDLVAREKMGDLVTLANKDLWETLEFTMKL